MGIYDPLHDYLASLDVAKVRTSFLDIEKIIGRDLPPSARKYPAWWANNVQSGSRQSAAWLCAGWRTEDLRQNAEEVSFVRMDELASPRDFFTDIAISLATNWVPAGGVALSPERKLDFPEVPKEPGVYRFRLTGKGRPHCYIGESENLRRRFGQYCRPGRSQATNLRLNELMIQHLLDGGKIGLDLITQIDAMTQSGSKRATTMSIKVIRKLVEQAAIVANDATEVASLNR